MKKNILATKEHVASALGVLMTRHGMTELTFTQEEYEEVYGKGQYIKLSGEFKDGEGKSPESISFTLISREEYLKEMH